MLTAQSQVATRYIIFRLSNCLQLSFIHHSLNSHLSGNYYLFAPISSEQTPPPSFSQSFLMYYPSNPPYFRTLSLRPLLHVFFTVLQGSGLASYVASLIDTTLTWNDIAWLRFVIAYMLSFFASFICLLLIVVFVLFFSLIRVFY